MNALTLEAARRGDRTAQTALLRELQDPWFRFCLSMLRDAEKAKDATQETALRFLKQLPTFRGDSQLQTWSMGIAINVVRELRRSANAPPVGYMRLATDESAEPSPVSAATSSEEGSILAAHLDSLPERQREAIVLRYFQDLSIDEAAKAMDCAPGTVKATIHQALRALKQKLRQLA